jgi:hypothetical protein
MLVTNERHNWKYLKLCRVYHSMMERCYSIKHHAYNRYGGRGIIVCDEWSNGEKFGRSTKGWLAFKEWALSHGYKDGLTIDRINNNKGYSPDNCRWVDRIVQANNTRRNVYLTINGETKTATEFARQYHVKPVLLLERVRKGMPLDKVVKSSRLNGKKVLYKGEYKLVADWCRELHLPYANTLLRLRRGWSVEKAFETK